MYKIYIFMTIILSLFTIGYCSSKVSESISRKVDTSRSIKAVWGYRRNKCLRYKGINQSGAEFAPNNLPGYSGVDYRYPEPNGSTKHFIDLGFNTMRFPFLLERLFPDGKTLNQGEFGKFKDSVRGMLNQNSLVLLDAHNYFRFAGQIIGSPGCKMSTQDFANAWGTIASHYKQNTNVMFGLMNEPHDIPSTSSIVDAFRAAIRSIRAQNQNSHIVVSGNTWDGAATWLDSTYAGNNANQIGELIKSFNDPKILCEMHLYLDGDASGTNPSCVSESIGVDRIKRATQWLKSNGIKGFLTETAVSTDPTCLSAFDNMLSYMNENCDAWIGFCWWGAGPWWGSYMFSIDPTSGYHNQLSILQRYI